MNKVFKNYKEHPVLKYDDPKLIFKIDAKVYIIKNGLVNQIIGKTGLKPRASSTALYQ